MQALMTRAITLMAAINRMTAGGDSSRDRMSLWDPLQDVLPFSAAWLGVLDGDGRRFLTAATVGHDPATLVHIESRGYFSSVESFGALRGREPIRLRNGGASAYAALDELWSPAGRHEGLGIPLIAVDGRPVGLLVLLTDGTGRPSESDCGLLGEVAPMITAAVDPMASITGLTGLVLDAHAAAVVGPGGVSRPLPGLPAHPLLATGGPLLAVASDHLRSYRSPTSFLYPNPGDDYLRITVVSCPPTPSSPFAELVIVSPPGDLHGLTRRELEVLGRVIDGFTNRQIASTLFITQRTVAAHLEHIRSKLGAPTRTAAAVRALNNALYVPPLLAAADN